MKRKWIFRLALFASIGVHTWLLGIEPAPARLEARPDPMQMVMFEAVPEPPPVPDESEVVEPPPPEPEITEAPVPAPEPAVPEPSDVSPPDEVPLAEPLPELTGTTLVADGPGDFSAPEGSGRSRRGAIRAGVSRPVDAPTKKPLPRVAPAPKPAGPVAVPLSQLSKKPVPPALGASLRKNYPLDERRQGRSGEAKVRALLDATGRITRVDVAEQSSTSFGAACRKTLLDSRWSAPIDASGKPVPTWITYRCKFRIDE